MLGQFASPHTTQGLVGPVDIKLQFSVAEQVFDLAAGFQFPHFKGQCFAQASPQALLGIFIRLDGAARQFPHASKQASLHASDGENPSLAFDPGGDSSHGNNALFSRL